MSAQPSFTEDWRGPGCSDACRLVLTVALSARFGREWVECHDRDAHERYGLRAGSVLTAGRVETGPVVIDLWAGRVTVDGEEIHLTAVEWRIMRALALRPGALLQATDIAVTVHGISAGPQSDTNWLRTNLSRIRQRLGPRGYPLIETAKSGGYRLQLVPPGRWAREHACCRNCGTTARRHRFHGFCEACAHRFYRGQLEAS